MVSRGRKLIVADSHDNFEDLPRSATPDLPADLLLQDPTKRRYVLSIESQSRAWGRHRHN